ncbi:cellulose biosynthesis protein BcsQ [Pectobacteriaceae bacterium CE70]|uniref:Cellulose synthase operon protein YhjQ n=1 Tax=Serratia sp. (strain ATCC 39006) TaxID=104623 RepID=A0A2I5T2W4_SERS3|nr:cellulose biosynthesis protein BcsQ [Serratia sp. ATCC 39006]AUG98906.1 cellulose synthase operon protein YhjQ [Serratia sp. ATCC 39006]AUH03221.1 cellulose synthase operon protein YhjQ [Serratia sp. ATCC 39006]WJV66782.1 cellulose biosynthesis protein BcsQ [Pectobacteriaceae bacterium CE70]WJY10777.1 cellulose biosynthesis protein BcsQ [Pectobacteriaceae bacterium C80]
MPLVCVCSPKGGVGKTTIAANLAYSLARGGSKVLAIDFDVQNALRLHFGVPVSDERGYVAKSGEVADWGQSILNTKDNIFVLPYGSVTEAQRQAFEHNLEADPQFLRRGLSTLLNYPGMVIIADFPSGPSAALKAMTDLADLHLVVMMADTASLSLMPHIDDNRMIGQALNQKKGHYLLLNQVDNRRTISNQVSAVVEQRMADKLLGSVHRDENVVEANASQRSIFDVSSVSAAAFDIELIEKRVAGLLNIRIGNGEVHTNIQIR